METSIFATKSEIREHKNPSFGNVHIIGLDMGYSGVKCFHENGNFEESKAPIVDEYNAQPDDQDELAAIFGQMDSLTH